MTILHRALVLSLSGGFAALPWFAQGPPGFVPPPEESQENPAAWLFTESSECARCHSASPTASAMRTQAGDDVSPHGLWKATLMANAFRDPYFRAQLAKERSVAGEAVEAECLRCHAPMAHHGRVLAGGDAPGLDELLADPLAADGVSCTMCHQIASEGLGSEETFAGRPFLSTDRVIFGPYEDPATGPMRMHVDYTPTHGAHVQDSAHCATCHTLTTYHADTAFPEQTPYLEWRNSVYSDEDGRTDSSRSCQECHMARVGSTRIARNPMGVDFLIPVRDEVASHSFVGGNAFVLDLLREHAEELGVTADAASLERLAASTRRQLREATATLAIEDLRAVDGHLDWTVRVRNRTGHKFPTGYPARRAFLRVEVRRGRDVVFASGAFDERGRLLGVEDELAIPHRDRVEAPEDVVVYELVAHDPSGEPTTHLTRMVGQRKDNRLLPEGWRSDGPHAAETAPVGTGGDADFTAGEDRVSFHVPVDGDPSGLRVLVWLHYQAVPPAWVDALRDVDAPDAQRFVELYDGADPTPETVDVVSAFVE